MMVDMKLVVACLVLLLHLCWTLCHESHVKESYKVLGFQTPTVSFWNVVLPMSPPPSGGDNNNNNVGNISVKCRDNERVALVSLKRDFVDPYGSLSSWGTAENQKDCCRWDNVFCDNQTGHVVRLQLVLYHLEGTISPSLAELHNLTRLELALNNFTPTQFPTFILSLKTLQYLDLSYTNLKGKIPLQLGYYLSHLQALYLEGNQLEGAIPNSLALCSLNLLSLRNNSLSGELDEFVASFNHCANISLQTLDLSHNRLNGSVPKFSQFPFLESLYLSNNQLNGTLNDDIGLLSKLKVLAIAHNFLQGVISENHFLRLSRLESLYLSSNDLTFNVSSDWIPPFNQLGFIGLASCKLGPGFPTWIRTQKSCSYLDISSAEISGTIPSWFWNLTLKHINLSHNQISGEMQNFQVQNPLFTMDLMDFSSNFLEGSIPSSFSSKVLMSLDLSNNKFTDASTLLCPNETVSLSLLDLSDNQLSGVLPDCWKYFERLAFLNVANNSLFGKIPASMGSLVNIQSLHLGSNKFFGEIPSSLNQCTELVLIDVAQNDFSGLIPSWIGDALKNLRVLILRSNMLYGSLPSNICNLSHLQILDLSMNNISGSLPKCLNHVFALANQTNSVAKISYNSLPRLGPYQMFDRIEDIASLVWKGKESKYQNILGLVKSIDLSSNMLVGEIPSELMDLVELVSLNISRNMFAGPIPANIGQLKSLDVLDMSRNELSGHIPSELSQIDRLSVMDLSYNNLSGEIPRGTQLQSFDPSTYEGNAHLCGAPLPKCPTKPTQDHPKHEENSEQDEQLFSRGFFISLSLGFSTGFWGICILIFLNKSFRYAYFRFLSDVYDKVYVAVAINVAKLRRWKRSVSIT